MTFPAETFACAQWRNLRTRKDRQMIQQDFHDSAGHAIPADLVDEPDKIHRRRVVRHDRK